MDVSKTKSLNNRPYPKDKGSFFGEAVRNMGGWRPYYKWLKEHQRPVVVAKKPKRNAPCHCGSGKKYKKCCI